MIRWTINLVLLAAVLAVGAWGAIHLRQPVPVVNKPVPPEKNEQLAPALGAPLAPIAPAEQGDSSSPTPADGDAPLLFSPELLAAAAAQFDAPPATQAEPAPTPAVAPVAPAPAPPPAPAPSQAQPIAFVPLGPLGGADARLFKQSLLDIAIDRKDNTLYVLADREVRAYDADGKLVRHFNARPNATDIAIGDDGQIYVAAGGRVERFSLEGHRTAKAAERVGNASGLAVGAALYVGDLGSKRVRRFDLAGKPQGELLPPEPPPGSKASAAMALPNGKIGLALAPDGTLLLAHPGRHRVEMYGPDGKLIRQWGRPDQRDPAGFVGCCNPIRVTPYPLAALGRPGLDGLGVLTSEKAVARVKLYDAAGKLLAVIGPEPFDQSNTVLPIAAAADGTVYVADPVAKTIYRFAPSNRK